MAEKELTSEDIRKLYGGSAAVPIRIIRPLRLSDVISTANGAPPAIKTAGIVCRCGLAVFSAAFERGATGEWSLQLTCIACKQPADFAVMP